jgi:hypothetical protein
MAEMVTAPRALLEDALRYVGYAVLALHRDAVQQAPPAWPGWPAEDLSLELWFVQSERAHAYIDRLAARYPGSPSCGTWRQLRQLLDPAVREG